MSIQLGRGTKRICQSATCALPFYDLDRLDVSCPNCGTVFDKTVVIHPRGTSTSGGSWGGGRRSKSYTLVAPAEKSESSAELDDSADISVGTDEVIDADTDTLPLEDEADDEIVDVVIPADDDRADR